MTAEVRPEIADLARWMDEEATRDPYGEISAKIVLHGGKVTRVERGTVQKLKPTHEGSSDARRHSR